MDDVGNNLGMRVLFLGSKELGLQVFGHILGVAKNNVIAFVTIDDSTDSRSRLDDIKGFCLENEKPVEVVSNSAELEKMIDYYEPDICFVVCWYFILPQSLLRKVPRGFVGVHNSLLPAYRGWAPLVWQMINGEKKASFSVFSFASGVDEGDIWHQESVEITDRDYICDVLAKIENRVLAFIDNHFMDMLIGRLSPAPQSTSNISYACKRTPEDGEINWKENSKKIYDFIRAQSKPYPGAFTRYNEDKVVIWRSEIFPYPIYGIPGQIGMIDKKKKEIVVVCGDKSGLVVEEVEIHGQIWTAADYIKTLKYKFKKQ